MTLAGSDIGSRGNHERGPPVLPTALGDKGSDIKNKTQSKNLLLGPRLAGELGCV
jgi:hypothetical protein